MRKLAFIFVIMLFAACSAKLVVPTQPDAERMHSKYPGYTLAELNTGKSLFENNCGSCHGLKKPFSRTEQELTEILPRMVMKVNRKAGREQLSSTDEQSIMRYLVTMSSAKK